MKDRLSRNIERRASARDGRGVRSDAGDTLVEILVTLAVIGITVVAILSAFATSISATAEHRDIAAGDTVLRTFAEYATYNIQQKSSPFFTTCAATGAYDSNVVTPFNAYLAGLHTTDPQNRQYTYTIKIYNINNLGTCPATSSIPPQEIEVSATPPSGATDYLTFMVVSPGSTSGGSPVTVSTNPSCGSIPACGPAAGNTSVTITGSGFTIGSTVTFGGLPAKSVTFQTPTSLLAVSPQMAGSTDPVDVVVTTNGSSTSTAPSDQFYYGPTVTGLTPNNGPPSGGSPPIVVTVSGSGFLVGVTAVDFGPGNPACAACVTVNSQTSLSVTLPASALSGNGYGQVDVTVTTNAGTSPIGAADTFTYGVSVTNVTPSSGPTTGEPGVILTGFGFAGATSVMFGSNPGTIVGTPTNTSLIVNAPAGTKGSVVVVVTSPSGTSSSTLTAGNTFTYAANSNVAGLAIVLISGNPLSVDCTTASGCSSNGTICKMTGTQSTIGCTFSGFNNGHPSASFYVETVDSNGNPVAAGPTVSISGTGGSPPPLTPTTPITIPAGSSSTQQSSQNPNDFTLQDSTQSSQITTSSIGPYTINIKG
jgi:type II secretory pathway pseudopilin PulG